MVIKKINQENNEIDISKLLKKWWSFRKLVIFGTIIVSLIATFILTFASKVYINKKQQYVTAVIKSDLEDKSYLIKLAYKSQPYIVETLEKISLDIDPYKLLEYLTIKEGTDPLTETLKNQILSTDRKKLKSLAFSNEELSKIIQNLNDNSKDLITIQLYHKPLNISETQAKNLIVNLSKNINEKLIKRVSRENNLINFIKTEDIKNEFFNNDERIVRLSNIVTTSQTNISEMKTRYSVLLKNYDLQHLSTLANISQKLLFEISKKLGNTIAIDTLNVSIQQKERDIENLKNSLEYLNSQKIRTIGSSTRNNTSDEISGNITQLDAEVFEKILSIGKILDLNSFRLNTVEKIQQLQQEKSNLIGQKDLLNLPFYIDIKSYNLDTVTDRVLSLAQKINKVNHQISGMTEPKSAFKIIKNPELIELNSKPITEHAKNILIFTILAFLIISFITILIQARR